MRAWDNFVLGAISSVVSGYLSYLLKGINITKETMRHGVKKGFKTLIGTSIGIIEGKIKAVPTKYGLDESYTTAQLTKKATELTKMLMNKAMEKTLDEMDVHHYVYSDYQVDFGYEMKGSVYAIHNLIKGEVFITMRGNTKCSEAKKMKPTYNKYKSFYYHASGSVDYIKDTASLDKGNWTLNTECC